MYLYCYTLQQKNTENISN